MRSLPNNQDDNREPKPLSGKKQKALALKLRGETDMEVAAQLHITRQTLYNWRKLDANFSAALEERRSELREQAQDGLLELSELAIDALRDALKDGDMKTRIQAARVVLGMVKLDKEEKESGVIELVALATKGIEGQLGIVDGKY